MMFEAAFAYEVQQALQVRDLHHTGSAEGLQGIVGEAALTQIATDDSLAIVSGKARVAHRSGLDPTNAGSKRVLLAYGRRDDLLKIHLHFGEEVLGQVAAVEAHGLVGIVSVVVVPIQQRAGRS